MGAIVIGGGPAGLMAAEQLLNAGHAVDLYDAMPTVGRKFLLAGVGGLNITHAEPFDAFCRRYGARQPELQPLLTAFGAAELRQWCAGLGVETFVGTSGRVFPQEMKAAPLLRKWLARLKHQGLRLHTRHRWQGWDAQGRLLFQNPQTTVAAPYAAAILALGGGSWKKLGSDGAWVRLLVDKGVPVAPLQPANCGFLCNWSGHLRSRFAGSPLKSVTLSLTDQSGQTETRMGEMILTERGVEGSLVYTFSARLRGLIQAGGSATFHLDLLPNHTHAQIESALRQKPARKTLGAFLKSRFKLDGAKTALLFETQGNAQAADCFRLASALKAIPVTVTATTPIDEAISTAGGALFEGMDGNLMLRQLPGVFCAGEMLDWEAPTGGYLLTACFATGRQAGQGAIRWLQTQTTA
ncbi:TIGR03862 family flavoprotein [Candidatus Thiothrix sp. Deng01]|uniref:TIGR03862 family flavoprotein n=1 Tax=Candidatus Thiothrix phosphatis TaxID=3112415 RepID=A0ABU6CTL4_9GAMM|nr:TIGR03862 family flavoprotein [Candidatus Thiothrix sp. Deng01]MEB4590175.1 TIGR03862 family flavoprotein [Candidatus Thiothrix sp. Deng01]